MSGSHVSRTHRTDGRRCWCPDCIATRAKARQERANARERQKRAAQRQETAATARSYRRIEVGQRHGRLVVVELAERTASGHLMWRCQCDCGNQAVVRSIHLGRGALSCGCLKRERSTERGRAGRGRRIVQVPSHRSAHSRVSTARGPASTHSCVDCEEPARDWSYDWSDPEELPSEYGPYSLDVDRYDPRCRLCHKRFDVAHRASQRQET